MNERGSCQVLDYIESLDKSRGAQVMAHLMRLRNLEPSETFKRVKSLGEGIFEVRPPSDRVLVCFGPWPDSIVLLRAFAKQSSKTPKREIDEARSLEKKAKEIQRIGGQPWPEIEIK
jgi:phage-related protein